MRRPYVTPGNPSPGDSDDFLNEAIVRVSRDPRCLREAGVHRGIGNDAGQWVELDDIGHAEAIHPHVDAAPVATAECAIRVERDALRLAAERFGHAGRRALEDRSEEHTSELQSQSNLACRLLLET